MLHILSQDTVGFLYSLSMIYSLFKDFLIMKKDEDKRTEQEKRSYTMSRIHSKNTSIEVVLRKHLWNLGIRYRINYNKAPGHPDIAITRYKIAIFCDGEFWHGKDWEKKKGRIKSNPEYWINKIERNMARDKLYTNQLKDMGWTVIRFWGNDIKKDLDNCMQTIHRAVHKAMSDKNGRTYLGYELLDQTQKILKVAEQIEDIYGKGTAKCK